MNNIKEKAVAYKTMKFSEYHCFCCIAAPLVSGLKEKSEQEIQEWLKESNLSPMRLLGLAQRAHVLSIQVFHAMIDTSQSTIIPNLPHNAPQLFHKHVIQPYAERHGLTPEMRDTCIKKWTQELEIIEANSPLLNYFSLNTNLVYDILNGTIPYLECYIIENWFEEKITRLLGKQSFLHSFFSYYNFIWNSMLSIFYEGLERCSVSNQCKSIAHEISEEVSNRIQQYRNFLGIDKAEIPTIRQTILPASQNNTSDPESELRVATQILPGIENAPTFKESLQTKTDTGLKITNLDWTRQYRKKTLESIGGYDLIEVVACGGMGVIYKATRPETPETYALKQLHQSIESDKELWKRFVQEATLVANLEHPNIVKFYDFGIDSEHLYLVMEYISGISLSHRIRRGSISIQEAVHIVKNILQGLSYAHSKGIIHRDIKPSNIMIKNDGQILILDFGLAKKLVSNRVGITKSGQSIGTPQYMSPEQTTGKSEHLDVRTDIYSVGTVFYEMLTGSTPFKGDTPLEILYKVINGDFMYPREHNNAIPKSLEAICLYAMAKEKTNRYKSADEMLQDIYKYEKDEKPLALQYIHVQPKIFRWIIANLPIFISILIAILSMLICILTIYHFKQ
ncbi:MAG: serine/threonine protein kinase [Planctomycetes bacterium]|jgi:tRNA A-37 threonylcarbamoyl transferase component Bud32|nr:serine/threonine protein kinase [Planctomycetota bacterium]HPY75477.1 serine/threonine-protein kinase [Planctomycetota bacterium]HQB01355.1 serine/threonine-protein kinase [Planctomycetota bacterium]HRU52044.1 serine/threonine-protein kinase [Planctomycetota bacterium]